MTLIVTAATREQVFQIADTRLTLTDGSSHDDGNVKTTVVHCADSKLLISYTGLAQIEKIRTDIWLVNLLKDNKIWEKSFPTAVKFIESSLTDAISRDINLIKYPLTFLIAGLGINKGKRDLAVALITNDEGFVPKQKLTDHKKIEGRFGAVFFNPDPDMKCFWAVYGALHVTPEMKSIKRQIEDKIVKARTNPQLDEVMHLLVAMLQSQRKIENVGKLISEDCTVAHIGSDYEGSLFYFGKDTKIRKYPNIVSKEITVINKK